MYKHFVLSAAMAAASFAFIPVTASAATFSAERVVFGEGERVAGLAPIQVSGHGARHPDSQHA